MANLTFDFLHNYVTGERRASDPADAYQYDEGHVLEAVVPVAVASCEIQYWIRGMEKADAYTPTSITQNTDNTYTILGNIPNSYFETNGDLRVYIVVTDGDASITTYEGYIHIKERQMPEDYVDDDPDNEAVRVITEAQAAAATATQKASDAAASAEQAQEILDSIPEDYSQLSEDVNDLKDDFHSYHSELGAGYADQLVSGIVNEDSVPYNFRKVPYDVTLEKVEGIVGADVVVNQLINHGNFDASGSWFEYACTYTFADGVATVTPTDANSRIFQTRAVILGHKYFMIATFKGTSGEGNAMLSWYGGVNVFVPFTGSWQTISVIVNNTFQTSDVWQLHYGSTSNTNKVPYMVKDAMCFDLTQTFGTAIADYVYSLETTTAGSGVAWLKKHFSEIFDAGYIAYNAGTMVHVSGLSAHKTVGFNQFDKSTVVKGRIDNGSVGYAFDVSELTVTETGIRFTTSNGYRGCTSDYFRVIPKAAYFISMTPSPSDVVPYVDEYDAEKKWIRRNTLVGQYYATIHENAKYARLSFQKVSAGTVSINDICINLSDPTRNGTYEPYTEHTYPLDNTIDLHGILKLDSNNQLYADGDVYKADGTIQRRYGVVDLGTLDWSTYSTPASHIFRVDSTALNPPAKTPNNNSVVANIACDKYTAMSFEAISANSNGYCATGNGRFTIVDHTYSDAASFKAAMNGVMLVYELATPTTETAEPYQQRQIIDSDGTEEFVSTSVVPVGHITKYPENLRKKIEGLPWNFATLIAPTEATFVATRNYTTGSLFIVNNVLYKATANIANGGTITPNTNCTATTLAEVISALS